MTGTNPSNNTGTNRTEILRISNGHVDEYERVVDEVGEGVGAYTTKIKWWLHNTDARPFGNIGYWGKE